MLLGSKKEKILIRKQCSTMLSAEERMYLIKRRTPKIHVHAEFQQTTLFRNSVFCRCN